MAEHGRDRPLRDGMKELQRLNENLEKLLQMGHRFEDRYRDQMRGKEIKPSIFWPFRIGKKGK